MYISLGAALRLIPNPRTLDCLANGQSIESVAPSYVDNAPVGPPIPDGENC